MNNNDTNAPSLEPLELKRMIGDKVAESVWEWLHNELSLQHVPWVTNPNSPDHDRYIAGIDQGRRVLLEQLRQFMTEKSEHYRRHYQESQNA